LGVVERISEVPNITKENFLGELTARYGRAERVTHSQSLFDISDRSLRIYVRYSKKHEGNRTFYGLRKTDLQLLEGRPSLLCFLWNNQEEPLLIPFSEFEEVFRSVQPADDGQYKVQVYEQDDATELYIANAGRFNVEGHYGWGEVQGLLETDALVMPDLSHSQVQTLIGSLGARKGYEIWVPVNDRQRMDWSLAAPFQCAGTCPLGVVQIREIVEEIDVIWTDRGSGAPKAFFEVEHSTPIYSALLRFNDVHILSPRLGARFSVVSDDDRRSLFVRQLNRPTFRASGLNEACNFLEYRNVYAWHKRITS
jgi:hypothetical protein